MKLDALKINGDRADSQGGQEKSGKSAKPAARKSLTKAQKSNAAESCRRAAAKAKPQRRWCASRRCGATRSGRARKCPCGKNCLRARRRQLLPGVQAAQRSPPRPRGRRAEADRGGAASQSRRRVGRRHRQEAAAAWGWQLQLPLALGRAAAAAREERAARRRRAARDAGSLPGERRRCQRAHWHREPGGPRAHVTPLSREAAQIGEEGWGGSFGAASTTRRGRSHAHVGGPRGAEVLRRDDRPAGAAARHRQPAALGRLGAGHDYGPCTMDVDFFGYTGPAGTESLGAWAHVLNASGPPRSRSLRSTPRSPRNTPHAQLDAAGRRSRSAPTRPRSSRHQASPRGVGDECATR